MNEIFDLRQAITSLQLQLQQEKLSKSKTNFCENEEKIVFENRKSHITSYKTENKFLKEEMKSNQNISDTSSKQPINSATQQTKKKIQGRIKNVTTN